jgi:hypothetical protein
VFLLLVTKEALVRAWGIAIVIAFCVPALPLAQGPDAGLRPVPGDFRAPVPVPPPPGAQPPGSPPRAPGAGGNQRQPPKFGVGRRGAPKAKKVTEG